MKNLLCTAAFASLMATGATASSLDLSTYKQIGTTSSGTGSIFYTLGLLTEDFIDPLLFNSAPVGGDFADEAAVLFYDFADPAISFLDVTTEVFDITDVGFSGDTIQFLMSFSSGTSTAYPTADAALLSITSSGFSTPATNLDNALDLESFFIANEDSFGEYAESVSFEVQGLTAIPGPASIFLIAGALAGLGAVARRRV